MGRTYTIFPSSAPAETTSTTILGTASAGTAGARGLLTHPDSATFPPITYEVNPDRVINLDNEALPGRLSQTILTLSDRKLVSFTESLSDVVCTEIWQASGPKIAMTTAFWRLLYEYYRNPPPFDQFNQTYIQWSPAYRTDKVYNVQIIDLLTGGAADPLQRFDLSDEIPLGGTTGGGDTPHGIDEVTGGIRAGMVDRSVFLSMKVVSEA